LIQLRDRGTNSTELRNGSRQVWVHLHAQWSEDFWCQEGQQRNHFSPGKNIRERLIFWKSYMDWTAEDWTAEDWTAEDWGSHFPWWIPFPNVWGKACLEKTRWALPSVLCHANSKASWDHSCVGLLLSQGCGLTHNVA
jgi:hypothetical protein